MRFKGSVAFILYLCILLINDMHMKHMQDQQTLLHLLNLTQLLKDR